MKLGIATCGNLAKAVVGEDAPFPSRSIRALEKFLHKHDIDDSYGQNDSKHRLACRAIGALDTCDEDDDQLHETLIDVIVDLAGPDTFTDFRGHLNTAGQQDGVAYLNNALAKHGLEVRFKSGGQVSLCFANDIPLSKGAASVTSTARFVFCPRVFKPETADLKNDPGLVAVMMPFEAKFDPVIASIRDACESIDLTCQRADDIWEETTVIDEIFALICRAGIVVCDMTDRNPNVLYEMGIAQTLGKPVVMLTQNDGDIPFDVKHHRYLSYLNNGEGCAANHVL